jgi:hypothetical protein
MSLDLYPDAPGADARNAEALALASDHAYLSQDEGAAAFRNDLALDAKLISVGNTQVFVGENDAAIVLAFRGTESPTTLDGLKDWLLTDAVNLLIVPEGQIGTEFAAAGVGARFHLGFMTALASVWDPTAAAVNAAMQKKERPLWITGHSLGGALAQLAAWRFQRQFVEVHRVMTFGAPMVGNQTAAQAFDRAFPGKLFRYVNSPDMVPALPTVSLMANAYKHCEKEMPLGGTAGTALAFLGELGARAVNGLLNATLMDDIWKCLTARVQAHDITGYRKLVTAPGGTEKDA